MVGLIKDQHRARAEVPEPVAQRRGVLLIAQLTHDEPGLDRLTQADVIGDKEVDPGQRERLAQRLKLVGHHVDAGAIGGLKEPGVRRRDAVPALRVQIGREQRRVIKAIARDPAPRRPIQELRVQLGLPEHLKRLPLRVIIHTGEAHAGHLILAWRADDLLDEVLSSAHAGDLAWLRRGRHGAPLLFCMDSDLGC